MSIQEGRDTLRVDGDYNDEIINSLIEAIPSHLETTTGKAWDTEPIHPLAKQTAKFLLQLWYDPQEANADRLKAIIDGLLTELTVIGRV